MRHTAASNNKAPGTTGTVLVAVAGADNAAGLALDPNGAIWLASYSRLGLGGEEDSGFTASLVKFNAQGSVDTRFSEDGKTLLPPVLDLESGGNAAVQPGGKYLQAHYIREGDGYVAAVSRVLSDGTLDTSFGNDGNATVPFYWEDSLGQQAGFSVQPDGSFYASAAYSTGEAYIARFEANGLLDPAFGDAGVLSLPPSLGIRSFSPMDVAVQPDGKLLIWASDYDYTTYTWSAALTRLNPDGTADPTFGSQGTLALEHRSDAMVLQPDGRILLASQGDSGPELTRVNADGSLDSTFGTDGILVLPFEGNSFSIADMVLLADGKIVIGGNLGTAADGSMLALVRVNPDGSLDTSFGNPDDGYQHLVGSNGADVLIGTTSFNDALAGGGGDDLIDGRYGRDLLTGGGGADVFRIQSIADSHRTATTASSDRITDFNPAADVLDLSTLGFIGLGNGREGTLALRVNEEGTRTYLKSFEANADGQRFEVVFNGDLGGLLNTTNVLFSAAQLQGTDGADRVTGTARAEVIEGLGGADRLLGGFGDDVLIGGADRDLLAGGSGKDVFRFNALADSYRTGTQNHADRILDYSAYDDVIDVSALGFTRLGDGHNGTLAKLTNESQTLTYLKSYDADATGARFELTLVGDHSDYGHLNIVFAGPPEEETLQMIGAPLPSEVTALG